MARKTKFSRYSHNLPVEFHTSRYEIHEHHDADWDLTNLVNAIVHLNLRKKQDVITLITGWSTGTGKSILAQALAEKTHELLHPSGTWPWKKYTAYYSWGDEFRPIWFDDEALYCDCGNNGSHPNWRIVVMDEAYEFAMAGPRTKEVRELMRDFGTGRFRQIDTYICGPDYLYFDLALRRFHGKFWIHLWGQGSIRILQKCPSMRWPTEMALWDCMGHVEGLPLPISNLYEKDYNTQKRAMDRMFGPMHRYLESKK